MEGVGQGRIWRNVIRWAVGFGRTANNRVVDAELFFSFLFQNFLPDFDDALHFDRYFDGCFKLPVLFLNIE